MLYTTQWPCILTSMWIKIEQSFVFVLFYDNKPLFHLTWYWWMWGIIVIQNTLYSGANFIWKSAHFPQIRKCLKNTSRKSQPIADPLQMINAPTDLVPSLPYTQTITTKKKKYFKGTWYTSSPKTLIFYVLSDIFIKPRCIKIWMILFWPRVHRWEKWSQGRKTPPGGRAEIENV